MATNYSPTIVTDGAVLVGDALMPSISGPGTRLYNRAGVDSADVKLLIHGNVGSGQNFADSSLSNHTITANGNVTHSDAQSKFSGGSIYFDGTGDYLTAASSSDFNLLEQDFTIDMWINFGVIENMDICDIKGYADGLSFRLKEPGGAGKIGCYLENNNHTWTWTPSTDTWYHLALVRHGATLKCYVDGTALTATAGGDPSGQSIAQGAFQIGQWLTGAGAQDFEGYIDELRFTKATALWTSNFTPPARRDTLSISDGMMYNGTCAEFDGTNDYVDTGSTFQSTFRNSFSFSTWVRSNDGQEAGLPKLMGMRNSTYQDWIHVGFDVGKLEMYYASNNSGKYGETASAVLGAGVTAWHHVVAVADEGAAQMYLYFDGVLQTLGAGSVDGDLTGIDFSLFTTTDNLYLAARNKFSSTSEENLNGSMADARLYNCALSAAQVKEIYDNSKVIIPSNVPQTNLAALWTLAEGSGDILYDGSGNGNNGTFENEDGDEWLTGQTGPPQLVEGYNRPMLFDGSNDYLEVPDDSSFDTTTKVSVAAWVYADPSLAAGSRGGQIVYTRDGEKGYGLRMRNDGSGNLEIRFSNGSGSFGHLSGSTALSAGVWYHLCGTYDTAVGKKVYVNGVQDGSDTDTGDLDKGTGVIQLGTRGGGSMFGGIFNEVIIYNSTLSLAQIQALAATGPNGGPLPPNAMALSNSSDIAGYWRNDSNLSWTDLSGNGNDTGSASGSPVALLFKQGINGSASTSTGRDGQGFPLKYKDVGAVGFDADATDYYINIAASTELDNIWDGGGTTDTWIYPASDGESDGGRIYEKTQWNLLTHSQSGANVKLQFYFKFTGTDGTWDTTSAVVPINEWSHIVVVYNADNVANNPTIYINGVAYTVGGGLTESTTPTSVREDDAGEALQIGNNDTPSRTFDGQIYGLKIYNRALSVAEITQNYNAQKSRFT